MSGSDYTTARQWMMRTRHSWLSFPFNPQSFLCKHQMKMEETDFRFHTVRIHHGYQTERCKMSQRDKQSIFSCEADLINYYNQLETYN